MAGIYVHIPFCASRCIYCGFYSTTGKENLQNEYVDALIDEFSLRRSYLKGEKVHTIYIGGGTPSLLSESNLMKIHEYIYNKVKEDGIEEFTMECNPDDITPSLAMTLVEMGVTRVSMGVQTFSDDRLRFLHRRHKASQIAPAIKTLRDAGIKNISIDLMFGFPGETLEDWREDLQKAANMGVEHISAYSLMYEEGTVLHTMLESGNIKENDEETSVEMYNMLIDYLTNAGYEHYEISNFAKAGYRSKHNSSYWNGTHYIGIGAAAHSFDGDTRGWNVSSISDYIEHIAKMKEEKTAKVFMRGMDYEIIDDDTRYNDTLTTALRTKEGIDLGLLEDDYYKYIIRYAQKGIKEGLLKIEGNHLSLTRNGLYISDDVMSDLIKV